MQVQGTGNGLRRNQDYHHHAGKPELFQREVKPGKPVSHQGTYADLQQGNGNGDHEGICERLPILHQLYRQNIIIGGKMLRNGNHRRIVKVALRHKTDGDLVEDRLQDQKAQTEHQQKPAEPHHIFHHGPLQQVAIGLSVSLHEFTIFCFPRLSLRLSHNSKPSSR
ncbi:hypothetical protein IMSAG185_00831 [Lachnospiraceae bacterium]|nr:hypothetical protein IMSAG185_00831 [Lachnospiraceae bacterium]